MPPPSPNVFLVDLLSQNPDWASLLEPSCWNSITTRSRTEGVAALVAYTARNRVGPEARVWCDQTLTRQWRRHDAALQELGDVVSLMSGAGVQSIALKGPVLGRRLYTPPFLRKPSGDLDIAVRRPDLDCAVRVLQQAGYFLLTPIREALQTSNHVVLRHESRMPLELHFRLSHGVLGIPVEEFFDRALPYLIPAGPAVKVLSPADELMHLILHMVHDRFATLYHSYEVRRYWLAASPELREQVIKKVIDHRFTGVFTLGDIAIRSVWGEGLLATGSKLPETWLHRRINEDLVRKMSAAGGHGVRHTLGTRLRGRWFDLQTTDRPADALRRVGSLIRVTWGQIRRRNWNTGRVPA